MLNIFVLIWLWLSILCRPLVAARWKNRRHGRDEDSRVCVLACVHWDRSWRSYLSSKPTYLEEDCVVDAVVRAYLQIHRRRNLQVYGFILKGKKSMSMSMLMSMSMSIAALFILNFLSYFWWNALCCNSPNQFCSSFGTTKNNGWEKSARQCSLAMTKLLRPPTSWKITTGNLKLMM